MVPMPRTASGSCAANAAGTLHRYTARSALRHTSLTAVSSSTPDAVPNTYRNRKR